MEKEEFYFNELILVLIVIIVFLSGFWYYNAINVSKAQAEIKIDELQNSCLNQVDRKSECKITQSIYDLENQVLCNSELKSAEQNLNEKIQNNYNLFEIKEFMRPTAVEEVEGLNGVTSIGEFSIGNDYFKTNSELKLEILANTGAIEGCISRNAKMAEFAKCDLKSAQGFVNLNDNVARSYFNEAKKALNSQEYMKAIYFTTAAISYSGETARQGYADIVEAARTQGLVC